MTRQFFTLQETLKTFARPVNLLQVSILVAILAVLYLISTVNFLLFHGIVELAGIAVAFSIFVIVWNSRRMINDTFFLIIGISFLFFGSIDLVHTLAYKGMGVFPGNNPDLATQLWIAARYFQSVTFLVATLFIGKSITRDRKDDVAIIITACTAACALLFASIFVWQNFPHCFVEGSGLTPFKILSEYIISLILIVTIVILYLKREHFDPTVWKFLIAAQFFLILGELSFTSYASVYGFMNILGHLFRLISIYLFYRAFVVVGITRPLDLLFLEFKKHAEEQSHLAAIVENTDDAIISKTLDGVITSWNAGAGKIYGYSAPDIIGRNFSLLTLPDNTEDIWLILEKIQRGELVSSYQTIHRRKDGERVNVSITISPVKDADGRVTGASTIARDITEQIRGEEALRTSERKYRTLFENMLEGFAYCRMIYDKDGRPVDWEYLDVNAAFERLTGLSGIRGKRVLEVIPDINTLTPNLFDTYGHVASTGRPETFEIDFKPLKMWMRISVFSPETGYFVAVFEDITGQKRALEEHLRLAAIVEYSNDAIIGKTLDGIITSWNAGAENLYGYTAGEAIGTPVSILMPQGERDETPGMLEKIRAGDQINYLETKRRRKDGRIIDVFMTISPIKNEEGQILGASSITHDITHRKRAEEALFESEKRYRDMFELNNAVMMIVNPTTFRIVDANSAASRYYGYTHEEFCRLPITDINAADPAITRQNLSRAAEDQGLVFNFRHRKKNGEIRDVEVFSAPIISGGQKLLHSIVQDVTDRKRSEEALQQVNKKLNLLSSITRHDINNQLFSILAFLELSKESPCDAAKISEYILKIERAAKAIERQIAFTKEYQDLGVTAPSWQPVGDCVNRATAALPMRDVKIDLRIPELEVYADPLFEKVFYNLIDNALRYGGPVMSRIQFFPLELENGLVIVVEDDGAGIAAEDKVRLFTKGFGHHTGLGLFLSREILSITGITITENGEPGKGARFEILVPEGMYRSTR